MKSAELQRQGKQSYKTSNTESRHIFKRDSCRHVSPPIYLCLVSNKKCSLTTFITNFTNKNVNYNFVVYQ